MIELRYVALQGAVKISCARQDPNARNCHGYRKFVKRSVLENPQNGFMANDTIVIRYTIELVVSSGGALSGHKQPGSFPKASVISVSAVFRFNQPGVMQCAVCKQQLADSNAMASNTVCKVFLCILLLEVTSTATAPLQVDFEVGLHHLTLNLTAVLL